jgi:hypothetical protein
MAHDCSDKIEVERSSITTISELHSDSKFLDSLVDWISKYGTECIPG